MKFKKDKHSNNLKINIDDFNTIYMIDHHGYCRLNKVMNCGRWEYQIREIHPLKIISSMIVWMNKYE